MDTAARPPRLMRVVAMAQIPRIVLFVGILLVGLVPGQVAAELAAETLGPLIGQVGTTTSAPAPDPPATTGPQPSATGLAPTATTGLSQTGPPSGGSPSIDDADRDFLADIGVPVGTFVGGAILGWWGSFVNFSREKINRTLTAVRAAHEKLLELESELTKLQTATTTTPEVGGLQKAKDAFDNASAGLVLPKREALLSLVAVAISPDVSIELRYTSASEALTRLDEIKRILSRTVAKLEVASRRYVRPTLPQEAKQLLPVA